MEKRRPARWRITQRYARRHLVAVLLSTALILIGLVLIVSALLTIAVTDSQSQSEPTQESLERAASFGIWGTVAAYLGAVLLIIAASRPAPAEDRTLDTASIINIERSGNRFFISALIVMCLVFVLAIIFVGNVAIPIGPAGLTFLLILRRAYVSDKRRAALRRQDAE